MRCPFGGLPCGSAGKESTCNVGDRGSIPGLGRSPGEGKGYPLQYSGLENSVDYSPFRSWVNPREISSWGKKEEVLALVALLLTNRDKVGVFYPPSARISSRYVVTLLESDAKKSVDKHCFPWSGRARVHGIIFR